jgi:hypothetical protein
MVYIGIRDGLDGWRGIGQSEPWDEEGRWILLVTKKDSFLLAQKQLHLPSVSQGSDWSISLHPLIHPSIHPSNPIQSIFYPYINHILMQHSSFQPWQWRQYSPLKCQQHGPLPHDASTQKQDQQYKGTVCH